MKTFGAKNSPATKPLNEPRSFRLGSRLNPAREYLQIISNVESLSNLSHLQNIAFRGIHGPAASASADCMAGYPSCKENKNTMRDRMNRKNFDVIVVGVGGMGSAACYQIAKRGLNVLGIEQFHLVHDKGSSSGDSRIFRLSQFGGAPYVALAKRSKELWTELEQFSSDGPIFHLTGGIDAGPEDGSIFPGALKSSQETSLPHEVLSAREAMKRYPAFSFPDHYQCLYQADAGILVPERGVAAHIRAARHAGADIHANEPVLDIDFYQDRVTVKTDTATYEAGHLVVCGGPWLGKLLPLLNPVLTPERGVVGWFEPLRNIQNFQIGAMPIFIIDNGNESFYGFPEFVRPGFKIGANTHLKEYGTAENLRRPVDKRDEDRLRHFLTPHIPDGNGKMLSAADCVWTLTPDDHFIIDIHPEHPNVAVAGGCSGYGYKFCPVIGEIMADFVQHGKTGYNLKLNTIERFKL